jgi:hypothetical protein
VADAEAEERRASDRARSLREDLSVIVRYPFVDWLAYCLLAAGAWVAWVLGSYGVLLSQGLLIAYAFTAINRVAAGNLKGFMPDIADPMELIEPLRLAFAALVVSSGPFLGLSFAYPFALSHGVASADRMVAVPAARTESAGASAKPSPPSLPVEPFDSAGEGGRQAKAIADLEQKAIQEATGIERVEAQAPAWVLPLLALALLWKVVYSPIALAVAAVSRSFWSTLNPAVGVGCIRSMGSVYWEAMGIYTVLVLLQWALGAGFSVIPMVGALGKCFVDAYASLAIGCTLGLAIFKKAPELGMD